MGVSAWDEMNPQPPAGEKSKNKALKAAKLKKKAILRKQLSTITDEKAAKLKMAANLKKQAILRKQLSKKTNKTRLKTKEDWDPINCKRCIDYERKYTEGYYDLELIHISIYGTESDSVKIEDPKDPWLSDQEDSNSDSKTSSSAAASAPSPVGNDVASKSCKSVSSSSY